MGGSNKRKKGSTAPTNPSTTRLTSKLTMSSTPAPAAKATTPDNAIRTRNNAPNSICRSVPSTKQNVPSSVFVSPAAIGQNTNLTTLPDHAIQTTQSIGHDDSQYETLLTHSTINSSTAALEATIVSYTRDHVWPKLKLITRGKDDAVLEYNEHNGTLCMLVLSGCNVPHQKWKQWWPNTKRIVARTITELRNGKVAAMRKAFFEYLLKRAGQKKDPISLSGFLSLRKAPNNYSVFIKDLVKGITGLKPFAERLSNPMIEPDELCTISDEAFALVTLENHYDRWVALFKYHDNKIPPVKSTKETKKRPAEQIEEAPNYTQGGLTFQDTPKFVKKGKGFSKLGIDQYNHYYHQVQQDRISHPQFLAQLCHKERERAQTNALQARRKAKEHIPEAMHQFVVADNSMTTNDLQEIETNDQANEQNANQSDSSDDDNDGSGSEKSDENQ